jgi:hypothetical protein
MDLSGIEEHDLAADVIKDMAHLEVTEGRFLREDLL